MDRVYRYPKEEEKKIGFFRSNFFFEKDSKAIPTPHRKYIKHVARNYSETSSSTCKK